jgi:Lon protease-like protein
LAAWLLVPESLRIIPLFPLPNLVLFPGVRVPLHIFEPRYREMVADVAERDRVIGMMLLKNNPIADVSTDPDIFEIGCAGRIDELVPLPDGRYNLVLEGFSEFRVLREIRKRSYRQAEVQWCRVEPGLLECDVETLEGVREMLFGYLGAPAKEAWRMLVEQRGLHGAELINFLCFHLDLAPIEKQTMLEALADRVESLLDVLAFKLEERRASSGGSRGGPDTVQ